MKVVHEHVFQTKRLLTFIILHGDHSDIADEMPAKTLNLLRKQYQCLIVIFFKFIYFERERERKCEQGRGRERGRERQSQADCNVSVSGLNSQTARSWPEPKQRVRLLTNWATQAPWVIVILRRMCWKKSLLLKLQEMLLHITLWSMTFCLNQMTVLLNVFRYLLYSKSSCVHKVKQEMLCVVPMNRIIVKCHQFYISVLTYIK